MSFFKIQLMEKDFIICEKICKNKEGEIAIEVVLTKYDLDGLLFISTKLISIPEYTDSLLFSFRLSSMSIVIENAINNRHDMNIEDCIHSFKKLGNGEVCINCLLKARTVIEWNSDISKN